MAGLSWRSRNTRAMETHSKRQSPERGQATRHRCRKIIASGKSPAKACLAFLETHAGDLIVLAVHQHNGHMRWLAKSVSTPIARGAGQMTLCIPHGVSGFVSRDDGALSLRNILIPVTSKPRPQPSVEAATRVIRNLRLPDGTVTLLYVGCASDAPMVKFPEVTGWTWDRQVRAGEPAQTILEVAQQHSPDLIVMTTEGPDGFLDGLREAPPSACYERHAVRY